MKKDSKGNQTKEARPPSYKVRILSVPRLSLCRVGKSPLPLFYDANLQKGRFSLF